MTKLVDEGAVYATSWERVAPYLAEFVGTFLITLTFLFNYTQTLDPVWAVTSTAFMWMTLIYAFGHISGANLNPSISIALWLSGRKTLRVTGQFCLVQILGAISAALLRYQVGFAGSGEVSVGPQQGYRWFDVLVVEVLYSAMITFVFLNCAASTKNNPVGDQNGFIGLAVGFSLIAGGYATHNISHAVGNSAVAVGLSIVDSHDGFSAASLLFLLYDLFGAFLGAGAYRIVRPQEYGTGDEVVPAQAQESAPLLAEFIGTFYLVLTKALNGVGSSGADAWSVAAALCSMVCALRGVSGGYFNPSVTLCCFISGRSNLTKYKTFVYVVAQVVAGIVATSAYAIVSHGAIISIKPNGQQSRLAIFVSEMAFTFLTCYVVLATSTTTPVPNSRSKQNNIAGLAYCGCIIVSGFSAGNVSGSMMNPAIALSFSGLRLLEKGAIQDTCVVYIVFELIGAVLAAGAFYVTHARLYNLERRQELAAAEAAKAAAALADTDAQSA